MKGNMEPATLSTKYDAKGLQPFFNLANSFMDTVQGKKLSEEFKGCMYNYFYDWNKDLFQNDSQFPIYFEYQ